MQTKKHVAYYRVSTKRQGKSGLGLEAQRQMVKKTLGDYSTVVEEFIEIESGRKRKRPQIEKALKYCREHDCTLVVAKLDRLARSVSFTFALKESGVDFIICDCPEVNTLTLGILATIAQYEAELISERTKAALAVKKKRGYKLGTPENLTPEAQAKGRETMAREARLDERNKRAYNFAKDERARGISYAKIADKLNLYGFKTPRNKKFYATSVKKLLNLYKKTEL